MSQAGDCHDVESKGVLPLGWPTSSGVPGQPPIQGVSEISYVGGDFGNIEAHLLAAQPLRSEMLSLAKGLRTFPRSDL